MSFFSLLGRVALLISAELVREVERQYRLVAARQPQPCAVPCLCSGIPGRAQIRRPISREKCRWVTPQRGKRESRGNKGSLHTVSGGSTNMHVPGSHIDRHFARIPVTFCQDKPSRSRSGRSRRFLDNRHTPHRGRAIVLGLWWLGYDGEGPREWQAVTLKTHWRKSAGCSGVHLVSVAGSGGKLVVSGQWYQCPVRGGASLHVSEAVEGPSPRRASSRACL